MQEVHVLKVQLLAHDGGFGELLTANVLAHVVHVVALG